MQMTAVTTSAAPPAGLSPLPPASGRAGLAGTLASEWTKIRSVRSTYWTLFALLVVGIGLGALVCAATASHFTHLGRGVPFGFDPTERSLRAFSLFGALTLMVLGAMTITAEYSTGMIRTSLTMMPRRGTVYAAKLIVFTVVGVILSLVTSFIAFFVGQSLLKSTGTTATLSQPNVLRAVIGCALYVALIAVISYAIGAIIRHTAGAIASMAGIVFVLPLIVDILPSNWTQDIVRWLPTSAANTIMSTNPFSADSNLFSAWGQLGVTAGYAVILLVIGMILFKKRDA
jgi:ABC-type transport system involved in multi-copper enzyme maturation permease subunit